jgi:hypothetical protein
MAAKGTDIRHYGTRVLPIELLVLGALRYLGRRGLTFDDLEEYTAINEETHCQFLHRFIEFGSKTLYIWYVKMRRSVQAISKAVQHWRIDGSRLFH